jgi:hypothetical protein
MRNTDALPMRRTAPGRSNCVILKLLYKIYVYAGVLKILIKFLSYALSLILAPSSSTRHSLILLVVLRSERMVPMILPNESSCLDRREINETRVLA